MSQKLAEQALTNLTNGNLNDAKEAGRKCLHYILRVVACEQFGLSYPHADASADYLHGHISWGDYCEKMKPEPARATVPLRVTSHAQRYDGKPTGETEYYAETIWSDSPVVKACGSVLGRGDSEAAAVADWNRRAQNDGHDVNGRTP